MSKEAVDAVQLHLMLLMQVSIVVPMAVVWRRKRHFAPAVKLLSSYVYLSAFAVLAAKALYPAYLPTNFWILMGFNFGKIALFGAVYRHVLKPGRMRRATTTATLVSLVAIALVSSLNTVFIVSFSRVVQCAVLAGMAMAYLEQRMSEAPAQPATQDPIWLLSLGQLVYSAGTVTAFSLDQLSVTIYDQSWKYIVVALIGMVFNYFLTLAFLRAKPQAAAPPVAGTPVQLAAS